jgi:hypothetical protein
MGETCNTHGRDEKCIKSFWQKEPEAKGPHGKSKRD